MLKPTPMKLERFADYGDAAVIRGPMSFLAGAEIGDVLLVINAGKNNWPGKVTATDIWGTEAVRLNRELEKSQAEFARLQQSYQAVAAELAALLEQTKTTGIDS